MSVFERRLSFRMLHFMKNDHKIILQLRWRSASAVSFAVGPWRSPSGGLGGEASDHVWRVNNR